MRLCLRLAALAALLGAVAFAMIHLRTDTVQAGNRLHSLFSQKRSLEKTCVRLELAIAGLKNQERLRQQAGDLLKADEAEPMPVGPAPPRGAAGRVRPAVADRGAPRVP